MHDGAHVGVGEWSGAGSGCVGEPEFVAESIAIASADPHIFVGDVRKTALREIGEKCVRVAPA